MIRLKDILNENEKELSSKQFNDIGKIIDSKYKSVHRYEYDEDYRGEFIRVTFTNYNEAIDFYNNGKKLLSKIIKVERSGSSTNGPRINGRLFIVSYKII
jgi:hypothetical protein